MPATLTIRDETPGGTSFREWSLEVLTERLTVRELIRSRVYQEVQDYNQRQPAEYQGLIQPTDAHSGVARFLESRGEGLHHVCFGTTDLAAELARLAAAGAELIDEAPRTGAEGLVAFIHPSSLNGVLWELLERDGVEEREPAG